MYLSHVPSCYILLFRREKASCAFPWGAAGHGGERGGARWQEQKALQKGWESAAPLGGVKTNPQESVSIMLSLL